MEAATLERLMDVAAENGGYICSSDVKDTGLVAARLVTLARRHELERVGHGIYRLPNYPYWAHDDMVRAILWTRRRGVISHEAALRLHELADVNPVAIDVTLPKADRISKKPIGKIRLHFEYFAESEIEVVEGVRVFTAVRTISDSIKQGIGTELIVQAIENARRSGRIDPSQGSRLFNELTGALHDASTKPTAHESPPPSTTAD